MKSVATALAGVVTGAVLVLWISRTRPSRPEAPATVEAVGVEPPVRELERLRAENAALRARTAAPLPAGADRLQQENARLVAENAALREALAGRRPDPTSPARSPGADPRVGEPFSSRVGEVRFALAAFGDKPRDIAHIGRDCRLSPPEIDRVSVILTESGRRLDREIRRLYVEVTGNTEVAADLDLYAAKAEIESKSPDEDTREAARGVSRELMTGPKVVRAPHPDQPAVEQLYRMLVREGPRVVDELTRAFGWEHAACLHMHPNFSVGNFGLIR
jgi:hypothetical protein